MRTSKYFTSAKMAALLLGVAEAKITDLCLSNLKGFDKLDLLYAHEEQDELVKRYREEFTLLNYDGDGEDGNAYREWLAETEQQFGDFIAEKIGGN